MRLDVRQLEKVFPAAHADPVRALAPVSFAVDDGEFVSLVGPSGCGKSTTLFLIAGLDEPSGGEIVLDGAPVTGPGRDRGLVFQNYTLYPWLTVLENAQFSLRLSENVDVTRDTGEAMAHIGKVYSLLDLMGLRDFYNAYPRHLSGGMKQRVAIARALANHPKVLLMDEPFGALDAQTREQMQELLLLLSRHERSTIVFVTHDVEEAIYLSTRILMFSARPGRILREIRVPFGPERALDLKLHPEFLRLKREIIALLHQQQTSNFDRRLLLRKVVQSNTMQ
jgi:NitT/TauT family transport system ATP-binding protein